MHKKVYLSGRFISKDLLKEWRKKLIEAGFEVVSEWLDQDEEMFPDAPYDKGLALALKDYCGVLSCDIFILNALGEWYKVGSGKHVETGMAIAANKVVIIVGQRENVLHYLVGDKFVVGSIEEAIQLALNLNTKGV